MVHDEFCAQDRDNLGWIVVTVDWAIQRAHQVGYASLNAMRDDYTADTTDGWALDALRDNALRGFGWGTLPDSNLD